MCCKHTLSNKLVYNMNSDFERVVSVKYGLVKYRVLLI